MELKTLIEEIPDLMKRNVSAEHSLIYQIPYEY